MNIAAFFKNVWSRPETDPRPAALPEAQPTITTTAPQPAPAVVRSGLETGFPTGDGHGTRPVEETAETRPDHREPPRDVVVGLEARARELAKELGCETLFAGFERHRESDLVQTGRGAVNRIVGASLIQPAAITRDFVLRLCQQQGVVLATDADIHTLAEISRRVAELDAEAMRTCANTGAVKEFWRGQDDALRGTAHFKGLREDHEGLAAWLKAKRGVYRAEKRAANLPASPIVLTIGREILKGLQAALLKSLKSDFETAAQWDLPFTPSMLTISIFSGIEQTEVELESIQRFGRVPGDGWPNAFWGIPTFLMSKEQNKL